MESFVDKNLNGQSLRNASFQKCVLPVLAVVQDDSECGAIYFDTTLGKLRVKVSQPDSWVNLNL